MKKCLSLLVVVVFAGCTSPGKPVAQVSGLSFDTMNGRPALVLTNPGNLTVLYASTQSDDASFFNDGRWLGTKFQFAAAAYNSPANQDQLVLPTNKDTRILIARGTDDPVFYVGLDREPCIPNGRQGEGCDGTFEHSMGNAYSRIHLNPDCLYQCSSGTACWPTKEQCNDSCNNRQCRLFWPPARN